MLLLDDVFAELDTARRDRLARLVAGAEQVLVTAAVPADVPASLQGARFDVAGRGGDAVRRADDRGTGRQRAREALAAAKEDARARGDTPVQRSRTFSASRGAPEADPRRARAAQRSGVAAPG